MQGCLRLQSFNNNYYNFQSQIQIELTAIVLRLEKEYDMWIKTTPLLLLGEQLFQWFETHWQNSRLRIWRAVRKDDPFVLGLVLWCWVRPDTNGSGRDIEASLGTNHSTVIWTRYQISSGIKPQRKGIQTNSSRIWWSTILLSWRSIVGVISKWTVVWVSRSDSEPSSFWGGG